MLWCAQTQYAFPYKLHGFVQFSEQNLVKNHYEASRWRAISDLENNIKKAHMCPYDQASSINISS